MKNRIEAILAGRTLGLGSQRHVNLLNLHMKPFGVILQALRDGEPGETTNVYK
jgi:hypothetical protein